MKANNSWQLVAGDYYWYEDGKPATGWRVVNGKHFYMNPETGKMMTGFYKDETGKLYYRRYLRSKTGAGRMESESTIPGTGSTPMLP